MLHSLRKAVGAADGREIFFNGMLKMGEHGKFE